MPKFEWDKAFPQIQKCQLCSHRIPLAPPGLEIVDEGTSGLELSDLLQEKLPLLLRCILAKLKDWGLPAPQIAP